MASGDEDSADGPLEWWARLALGLVGLGFAVVGVVAVFLKDTNVAGVPLLIVAGGVFVYVAVSGQRLLRVSRDGVVLGRAARRVLRQVVGDPDVPEDVKDRIVELAEDNGLRISIASWLKFESVVAGRFAVLGMEHGFRVLRSPRDVHADLVLVNNQGRQVPVEVTTRTGADRLGEVIRQLRHLDFPQRILVVQEQLPGDRTRSLQMEGIWVLSLGPDSEREWTTALRTMEFLQA